MSMWSCHFADDSKGADWRTLQCFLCYNSLGHFWVDNRVYSFSLAPLWHMLHCHIGNFIIKETHHEIDCTNMLLGYVFLV